MPRIRSRRAGNRAAALASLALTTVTLLLAGCASPGARESARPQRFEWAGTNPAAGPFGPTLHLAFDRDAPPGNPIGEFMYFAPLISPEPVSVSENAGNTQRTRVRSVTRTFQADSFAARCEFEITGAGWQRNTFDPTNSIRRNEKKLREGGVVERALSHIHIEGAGSGWIEVEGTVTNRIATVTEVRLQFNARSQTSPVTIGLNDLRSVDGVIRTENEIIARVNTLAFRRGAGRPRMAVTVASVRRKDAGDNLWQKLKGNMAGAMANLLIKPLGIERAGNDSMLNFGRALAAGEPDFTFPRARNLRTDAPSRSPSSAPTQ